MHTKDIFVGKSLIFVLLCIQIGCIGRVRINSDFRSVSQDSRVQFIVIHYTGADLASSLQMLTTGDVSSHYLINDDPPITYRLVDESRRAYHAGESFWKGTKRLNAASIGIELVYSGPRVTPDGVCWPDYPQPQIEALIQLLKKLVAEYGIKDGRIVGHGEVAPGRKMDPGPKFPWFRLAGAGLMKWPNADVVAERRQELEKNLPDIGWFQARLASLGYLVQNNGEFDALTRSVIVAFQMKYRPLKFDGSPDAETGAILDALTRPEMGGRQGKDDRGVLGNL